MGLKWLSAVLAAVLLVCLQRSAAQQPEACTVISTDEIKGALGRSTVGAAKPGRGSGAYSECTFPGLGASDVRILLGPPSKDAADDFALKAEVLQEERQKFDRVTVAGGPRTITRTGWNFSPAIATWRLGQSHCTHRN
jgi:hypothetical protein